jgi:hypothetical protein
MKRYAQFYLRSCMTGELVPGCGTDSVYILDGRWGKFRMEMAAVSELRRRKRCFPYPEYVGYAIVNASSFRELPADLVVHVTDPGKLT